MANVNLTNYQDLLEFLVCLILFVANYPQIALSEVVVFLFGEFYVSDSGSLNHSIYIETEDKDYKGTIMSNDWNQFFFNVS